MKFRLYEDALDKDTKEYIENEAAPEEKKEIETLESKLNFDAIEDPTKIEKALDRSLRIAIQAANRGDIAGKASNLLIVGRAGTGKTKQVKDWAKLRNINFVMKDVKTLDPTDIGGIVARAVDKSGTQLNSATKLTNSSFDSLNELGSVLFLDELNRASAEVQGSLLTLILDHLIEDTSWTAEDVAREGGKVGMRPLPNFLFTVAAINPTSGAYEGVNELDMAMRGRFRMMDMGDMPDTAEYLRYIKRSLNKQLEEDKAAYERTKSKFSQEAIVEDAGRIALATKLLSSPLWKWDSAQDEMEASLDKDSHQTLSPRDFSAVIRACDGTKDDLIEIWPEFCNESKLDMVEEILSDYVDIDDKANSVFKDMDNEDDDDGGIFGKTSMWDELDGLLDRI